MGLALGGGSTGVVVDVDAAMEVDEEDVDAEKDVDVCVEVDVEGVVGGSVRGGAVALTTAATPVGLLISVLGPVMVRMGDAFPVAVAAYTVTLS